MKPISNEELNNIINNELPLMGIFLTSPNAYHSVAEMLKTDIFYIPANKILYEAIEYTSVEYPDYNISQIIDYLTTTQNINSIKYTYNGEEFKGIDYLQLLIDNKGIYKDTSSYLQVLIGYAKKRELQRIIDYTLLKIENTKDIGDVINELQLKLIDIDLSDTNVEFEHIKDVAKESLHLMDMRQQLGDSSSLKFGYPQLDALTLGFNPGDLVILAARPSMGKTAFALNIASKVAKQGKSVLFFSLEMSNVQLVERIISSESSVPLSKIKKGEFHLNDRDSIDIASKNMEMWKMFLNDKSSLNISDLLVLARRFNQGKKLDLVIVDYLQLVTDSKSSGDNRQLEVSKISRSLKQLAREIGCPVIALSQLSRKLEQREDKQPMLSDLRESGAIEQDADAVMFLYRPDYYNKKYKGDDAVQTEDDYEQMTVSNYGPTSETIVIVAKNRNGATGATKVYFAPACNYFFENKE
ncbi:replicative DNA helicase [Mycoplasma phocoenae]|uniref:Replicative DNA helicase n=1 Tax=Mycoplasma phocoenae TaxID=754517 RepID=A0A858U7U8_9MOLU|nr:replicative DNA helicase [Mycoplasma phocoenae]QJG66806.1 replicative DNA helicase [Mycoplasma phocoenae]